MYSADMSTPNAAEMYEATACRTSDAPAADVYPCRASEGMVETSRTISSFTSAGAGTPGLPSEKSKTFSAPTTFLRALPYSKISRMTERASPSCLFF